MGQAAAEILKIGLLVWFAILFGLILLKLLIGELSMEGLFQKSLGTGDRTIDLERLQSALIFAFTIASYAMVALTADLIPDDDGKLWLPDVPEILLVLLGGSNGLYLAGKMFR